MTTEVLRNMIYARSPALDGLALRRARRGALPPGSGSAARCGRRSSSTSPREIAIVALSATVSNAEEVAAWMRTVRGETEAVIEERRPVELVHLYLVGERGADALHLLPTFVDDDGELRPNPVAARLDGPRARAREPRRAGRGSTSRGARRSSSASPTSRCCRRSCSCSAAPAATRRSSSASRAACGSPTRAERVALRRIADAHLEDLADDDLDVLGYDSWLAGLEAGVAAHHAGMVPPMKEAVEEAFTAGLVKVVFATETLSLGINMPARSVVIEKLSKFTGEHHELLTPGEYTQLAGRAGRRGIDEVGYAVVLWDPFVGFDQVAGLASRRHVRAHVVVPARPTTWPPTSCSATRATRPAASSTSRSRSTTPTATRWRSTRQLERTREQLERAREAALAPGRRHRGVPGPARRASTTPAARCTPRRTAGSTPCDRATS